MRSGYEDLVLRGTAWLGFRPNTNKSCSAKTFATPLQPSFTARSWVMKDITMGIIVGYHSGTMLAGSKSTEYMIACCVRTSPVPLVTTTKPMMVSPSTCPPSPKSTPTTKSDHAAPPQRRRRCEGPPPPSGPWQADTPCTPNKKQCLKDGRQVFLGLSRNGWHHFCYLLPHPPQNAPPPGHCPQPRMTAPTPP